MGIWLANESWYVLYVPSSENERKEGTRKERDDCEWFTLRHLRENHPSSA